MNTDKNGIDCIVCERCGEIIDTSDHNIVYGTINMKGETQPRCYMCASCTGKVILWM